MRVIINNKEIGKNIKKIREKNNVSLDDLSLLEGIAKNTLMNYESGNKQITINDLIFICNHFNVTIDSMVSYQII